MTNTYEFEISIGASRHETNWKNIKITWPVLLSKLSTTHRTHETVKEYHSFTNDRQSEIKDIGGFVGGVIQGGRRKKGSVISRSIITLDVDHADQFFWDDFQMALHCAACVYSTHSHTREKPRLRLIIPLDRAVNIEQYQAVVRKVAERVHMASFDHTSFRPTQLMYWPSTPSDGEYIYKVQDGPFLPVDKVLKLYVNWQDSLEWPVHPQEQQQRESEKDRQGDPTEKPGMVGAFCRTYTIKQCIEKYLPDVYTESADDENRYTYTQGTTANGLVIYDDDLFCYSHHATDPAGGRLCNAFDLVRLHKFSYKDEKVQPGTPVNKLPSYVSMCELAAKDDEVKQQLITDKYEQAKEDFAINTDSESDSTRSTAYISTDTTKDVDQLIDKAIKSDEWRKRLDVDNKGNIYPTINNIMIILENDLAGCFAFNAFENREVVLRDLPWRKKQVDSGVTDYMTDADDAGLRHYLERTYDIVAPQKIKDALTNVFAKNKFHPVRDYLNSCKWDGVERVETLLVDYFGAEDNDYVRTVTRKTLVAAVKRVMEPGCKFDYVLTLVGPQGEKKSMFWDKLARGWFSDTFNTVVGKEAVEQILGVWIIEIAELAGFKRAEIEQIKNFISKRFDRLRVAYGKRVETFYRQCIMVGTTNNYDFLTDQTGNRRYWAVEISPVDRVKDVSTIDDTLVSLIWGEVLQLYRQGEKVYLDDHMEILAKQVQENHTEVDERSEIIERYLNTLLPDNWQSMNVYERRNYLRGEDPLLTGKHTRNKVTIYELWTEALGLSEKDMTKYNTKDIHHIMMKVPGWERHKTKIRTAGKVTRGYVRTGAHELFDFDFLN